jgi:hypothetical protein
MHLKGPYEVLEKVGELDDKIKIKDKVKMFHINMLKSYVEREDGVVVSDTESNSGDRREPNSPTFSNTSYGPFKCINSLFVFVGNNNNTYSLTLSLMNQDLLLYELLYGAPVRGAMTILKDYGLRKYQTPSYDQLMNML